MSSPAAMQVWKTCADLNVPMTLIIFYNQLPYVLPLLRIVAKMYPSLPIVIDHLGTAYGVPIPELAWAKESGLGDIPLPPPPDFGIGEIMRLFADTPNVYFKLTEVNMERLHAGGISAARLVRRMADSFGAERLVWGSDVGQSLRWPYAEKATMGRAAADFLSAPERALFLYDNAARIYAGGTTTVSRKGVSQ
jgi:predicted TIM-barrel fold metal-dependent hydrolase